MPEYEGDCNECKHANQSIMIAPCKSCSADSQAESKWTAQKPHGKKKKKNG